MAKITGPEFLKFLQEVVQNIIYGAMSHDDFAKYFNFCKAKIIDLESNPKYNLYKNTALIDKLINGDVCYISFTPFKDRIDHITLAYGNNKIELGYSANSDTCLFLNVSNVSSVNDEKYIRSNYQMMGHRGAFIFKVTAPIKKYLNSLLTYQPKQLYHVVFKTGYGESQQTVATNDRNLLHKFLTNTEGRYGYRNIISITPYNPPKKEEPKAPRNQKKWKVTYRDNDDISTVWVYADNEAEAKSEVKSEYWDCKEILVCQEIKENKIPVFNSQDSLFECMDVSGYNKEDLVNVQKLYNYIVESGEIAKKEGVGLDDVIDNEVLEGFWSGLLGGVTGAVAGPAVSKAIMKCLGIEEKGLLGQLLLSRVFMGALGYEIGYRV